MKCILPSVWVGHKIMQWIGESGFSPDKWVLKTSSSLPSVQAKGNFKMPSASACICLQESLLLSVLPLLHLCHIHWLEILDLLLEPSFFRDTGFSSLLLPIHSLTPRYILPLTVRRSSSSSPRITAQVGQHHQSWLQLLPTRVGCSLLTQAIPTLLRFTQDQPQNMQTYDFVANPSISGMVMLSESMLVWLPE